MPLSISATDNTYTVDSDEDSEVSFDDEDSEISNDELLESIEEFKMDGSVIEPTGNVTVQGIKLKYSAILVSASISGKCDPSLVPFVDVQIRQFVPGQNICLLLRKCAVSKNRKGNKFGNAYLMTGENLTDKCASVYVCQKIQKLFPSNTSSFVMNV